MPVIAYRPPVHNGLDILHEDDALLALNKPAGLLAVPGRGEDKQDCLAKRVQAEYPGALVVHRLDMATSGLMVFAKNTVTQGALGRLFAARKMRKRYVAVVEGLVPQASGSIDLPLICDWPNRPKQIVDHARGKPALTVFRVLQRNVEAQTTRLQLEPETGRTHQLRVHLQALGHPILGDPLYAGAATRGQSASLLLHAESLSFIHPHTQQPIQWVCDAPF